MHLDFVHMLRLNTFCLRCGEQFLCFDMVFRRNRLGSTCDSEELDVERKQAVFAGRTPQDDCHGGWLAKVDS